MDLFIGERKKLLKIRISLYDSVTVGKTDAVVTAGFLSGQWALSHQRLPWSLYPGCAVTLLYLVFSCLLAGAKKGRSGTLPINHSALSAMEEESQVLHKSLDSFSFHFPIIQNVLSRD